VEIAEDAVGVVQTSFYEEGGGGIGIVDDVRDFQQRLGAVFVRGCDLAEVGDEVLEKLSPSCQVSVGFTNLSCAQHTLEAFC